MKVNKLIKIILTEEDVKAAISDWLNIREGYKIDPKDVEFSIGTRCEGYGLAEHYVQYFKECVITIKENK